jgi:hypothetical protein
LKGFAMDTNTATERTPAVLMAEVRYGIVFGEMNEIFNGRLHRTLKFLSLVCGGLSAAGFLTRSTPAVGIEFLTWWSLFLGASSIVAGSVMLAFRFDERERRFCEAKKGFQTLEGRGWGLAQGTLQRELAKLLSHAPAGGDWLAALAYNRACRELGHPEVQMDVPATNRMFYGVLA